MVIECIGLPGSGKTELTELIEKELKRREVDYVNVSANLRSRISWKFLRAIAELLIFLSADARWLRDRLRGILQKEGAVSSFGVYDNEKRVIRSLAVYSFWYRRMIRSHRILYRRNDESKTMAAQTKNLRIRFGSSSFCSSRIRSRMISRQAHPISA